MTFTENPWRFLRKLKMRQNNTVFHFWWESLWFFDNFAFFFAESMFYVKNFQNWKNHYKNRWFYKSRVAPGYCGRRSRFAICGGSVVAIWRYFFSLEAIWRYFFDEACWRSLVVRGRLFAVACRSRSLALWFRGRWWSLGSGRKEWRKTRAST